MSDDHKTNTQEPNKAPVWHQFRDFALRGNLVDLAVGLILGTAFNQIVQSLVDDIVLPIIGMWINESAFTELYINLSDTTYPSLQAAQAAGAPLILYGQFVSTVLDFFLLALSVFIILKYVINYKLKASS